MIPAKSGAGQFFRGNDEGDGITELILGRTKNGALYAGPRLFLKRLRGAQIERLRSFDAVGATVSRLRAAL